jgi:type II secretory pathway pseudopilin PulG
MKKGQFSIETILVVGIILFIFVIVIGLSVGKSREVSQTQNYLDKRSTCLKLAGQISSAFNSGYDTNITTSLDYNTTINSDSRLIYIGDTDKVSCTLFINSVTNSTNNYFSLKKGDINIINKEDNIIIKNV